MKRAGTILFIFLVFLSSYLAADEGMWPVSDIQRLDLRKAGFRLTAAQIFQPGRTALADAVVDLGGGTGCFVSADGLIVTNHHVSFNGIQRASSVAHDYLTNGFLATDRGREISAVGYTARIVESWQDVSERVLSAAAGKSGFLERNRAMETRMKEIVLEVEKQHPGKRAEVAEMFPGRSYMLFVCTYLKDVRLVYAPPLQIGNFGGEADNWVWPRHTGDFTFLRAYCAPDGSAADYSAANVPYHPKTYAQISPQGVREGDLVFILGYPGRTFRHQSAAFLAYEEQVRLPATAEINAWQIEQMERMGADDPALAIRFAGRIKGLANTMKNARAKLAGLQRLQWAQHKREEEARLSAFIAADPIRAHAYGDLLAADARLYGEMTRVFARNFVLDQLTRMVNLLQIGYTLIEAADERIKPDVQRESAYMDRNFEKTRERLSLVLKNYHPELDRLFLAELLRRAAGLPLTERIAGLGGLLRADGTPDEEKLRDMYARTRLADEAWVKAMSGKGPAEVRASDDPLLRLALALYPDWQAKRESERVRKGESDGLAARMIEVKQLWQKTRFIPDANSTLRLTFGRIRGYSPRDGVYMRPFTTIRGILEKENGDPWYVVPPLLKQRYTENRGGAYVLPGLNDVPVAMLYDLDTTGGNSGSPVFDASGRLVGINFDRALEAVINDYLWSPDFSRSIAVDMRYVLWVTRYIGGAENVLKELGVPPYEAKPQPRRVLAEKPPKPRRILVEEPLKR